MQMVTVSTTEELLDALLDDSQECVLVRSGQYRLPDDDQFAVVACRMKRVIGIPDTGPVQIIGRMTWQDCDEIRFDNLCLRAPIEDRDESRLTSYDCLTINGCRHVTVSRCSIMGGADETLSIINSSDCAVINSLIGIPFATTRNHDMLMLVSCDNFVLMGCVLTGGDRRKPQVQEYLGYSTMLIADNHIDCGQTMTVGLKPQMLGFDIDIVNNVFERHNRTRTTLEEVEAVNGSSGQCRVFCDRNTLGDGRPAGVDWLTNGEHLEQVAVPQHWLTREPRHILWIGSVGPTVVDAWHTHALASFGSGREWKTERDPGFPSL
jgi:hypothetical protein